MKKVKKRLYEMQMEGDIYTAIGIYQSLPGQKKFLLESSLKHEQQGRYSFIGSNPYREISSTNNVVSIINEDGSKTEVNERFLDIIKQLMPDETMEMSIPFVGGAVGYVGYDIIRQYEDIGEMLPDELDMPEAHMLFYRDVVVYDHMQQSISIVAFDDEGEEQAFQQRAEQLKQLIQNGVRNEEIQHEKRSISFHAHTTESEFHAMVEQAKEDIYNGEIFQVVLSQRFSTTFTGDPFYFYRCLRKHNPSPYMFYIDFEEYQIVGASPESLLKGDGVNVVTNPIAGTRKRGSNAKEDRALEEELLQDEKELAEHRMLVDLGRNDLGRVCEMGTVKLTKYLEIEKYKHVMHIVSEVSGRKRCDISNSDVLASCLPAGTVSGAPKIRAMSIINELEHVKRNVYAGAVGYFSMHGHFDFALAIRTMIVKDGKATIQAGAGIVYDSDPHTEFQEVMNKARAFMEVEV